MVFADWTVTGDGSAALDAVVKYAGSSSCKITYLNAENATVYVTHDTFLEPQAQVIYWQYRTGSGSPGRPTNVGIEHSSYGALDSGQTVYDTWEKFRATYWYDILNDIRWGRIEKWNGSSWDQVGNDTNFGSGSPSAGSIKLKSISNWMTSPHAYFDEVEVSA